ncbi:MAG: peptide-methionine (S)-S-oxide reductase MsrA [Halodesulfurarchaeum sp.]
MTGQERKATVAGGCFWCIEAAFKEVPGVESVTSGYAGGSEPDPTYEQVATGETGHAEAVQIAFDPERTTYAELLGVFFRVHDPTQLNRQGPDVGTQYRSAIFTHDEAQQEAATAFVETLEAKDAFEGEIVTEVEPLEQFWPAGVAHQDYYENNPEDAYCTVHAEPKVRRVQEIFAEE